MKILSLDPGIEITGWACMDGLRLLECATIRPFDNREHATDRINGICAGLLRLLSELGPAVVLIEWDSGHVNRKRHKGGGAGLATHGAVTAALWREAVHWARGRQGAEVVPVDENLWTRGVPKDVRALAVAAEYVTYPQESDIGCNIADAIGLAVWWARERRVRGLAI